MATNQVMETVAGFNAALQALAEERTRVDVCVAGLEFKCLELAAGLEDDEHRRGVVEKLEAAAGRVADRRQRRQQLIEDLSAGLEEVLAEYDVLHGVERRMDRAFKKSYSQMDQVWPLLYKVYRDRRHAPTGNRVASPAEMMKEEGGGGDSGDVEPRKTSDQQDGDEGRDGGGGGGRSVAPLTTALARQLMWCGTGELGPQEPARPEVDVSPVFLPAVAPVYAVVPPPSSLLQPEAGAAAAGSGGGGGLTERHIAASLSEAAADVSNSRNNVVAAATGDDGSPGSAIVQAGAAARSPSAAGAAAAAGAHRVSRLPLSDRLQALTQRGGRPLHVLIDDFLDAQSIASRYQQLGLLGLGGAPGRGSGTSGGGGGISRSSSVRYDGRHGGAAAADADSDASAADAAAAEEEEYYSDPFATSALVRYFRPSVPSAAPVTAGAAAASATSPDHSPTRPAAVEDGREDGGGSSPAATSTAGQQLQQPFTLDDKPDGVDLTTWEHVLAWRDSRMQLQAQVQGVWVVLCQLALQLDVAEAEALRLEGQLESDMGAAADTTDALTRDSFDMLHSFTVKSSQMELPRGMVQDLFNTVLLHGFVATKLNDAVRGHNNDKLAQLASVKKLRGAIHSGRWRCGAADIQIRHTADMLREIQILNVSREAISALQAGRNDAAADEEAPGKAGGKAAPMNREEAIAESMAFFRRGHKRNIDMRSAKLAGRKESAQIAVQEREELEALLGAAEDAINSSSHLAAQAEVQQRFERAAQERLLKSVKSNNQLKSIAEAQQAHIAALRSELSARMERAFPVLPPPGKGSPRARAASAAAGSAPPDPAVAALTTFVPPPSHGERSSGGSAALSPTNRPTSSSAGPNRTTPLNMFASSPTTSSPVMAAGAMRSRTTPRTGSADASATVQLPPISSPSAASQLINAYGGSPKKGGSPLSPKLVRPTTAAPGAAAASRPSPSLMPPQQLVLEAPHSPKAVLARPTLNRRH